MDIVFRPVAQEQQIVGRTANSMIGTGHSANLMFARGMPVPRNCHFSRRCGRGLDGLGALAIAA
jgi:hypothetical protein